MNSKAIETAYVRYDKPIRQYITEFIAAQPHQKARLNEIVDSLTAKNISTKRSIIFKIGVMKKAGQLQNKQRGCYELPTDN